MKVFGLDSCPDELRWRTMHCRAGDSGRDSLINAETCQRPRGASGVGTVGSDSVMLIHAYVVLACASTGM